MAQDDLQFDRAEYDKSAPAATRCSSCAKDVGASYFMAEDRLLCAACRGRLENELKNTSGFKRFFRATLYGISAAVLGAGIYFAVSALTGYEFGLIAILVGFMVGGAVRGGSNRQGGWLYQALAMLLTYSAIVATYVPQLKEAMENQTDKAPIHSTDTPDGSATPVVSKADAKAPEASSTKPQAPEALTKPPLSWLLKIIGYVFLFILAFFVPFLSGLENIMGLIIIGIGLYEAWRLNKCSPVTITGPFNVSPSQPPAP